ncbi:MULTISPECIES: restriction endonuclease fold toxin 5 domain-containing protein [Enterobacter cloacae complex]|uniref:restriction endonuclease fold toxin 5 domain-containing protein n=1 Tax=Enterobacter cloacae complex TaxID=354276 RepID=UPI0015C57032|nr:restriction endonuclease fold toxin 5 domain-containing protein [Enterobacter hormaechei]MCU2458289.1 restriction endonuclease fold toxin 5 domain-containing protein [Enterobacter hormaechei subsp. hoffmannii]ELY2038559.1 restriction endonuclease fold toxin 5 domain-containing protein [Enterobacter hormaechei]MCU3423360.1 restriction endonuclease fold toxin 5 domain-containing protein [Enterobacter hormaechei subsp. hoffmannii]MCU3775249.1 restriction endonuclease fold toxin 5 domain-contain
MSDIGSTFPVPSGRTGTFPRARGGRLGGVIGIIQELDSAREAYLVRMAEMEKVKVEAATMTKEMSEEGCDQCVYTHGQVTLQNIEGWSDVSIAYQFYICQLPIHFPVMKIMEWTYGVAFDGFAPKECVLKESKANYDQFFDSNGDVKFFMTIKNFGEGLFIKQATAQNACAIKGMPPGKLEWYFMQPISAKYARIEFASEGLDINVIYKPMSLDYIKNIFPD